MKILIIACNGQLGVDATSYFSLKHEVIACKDIDLDITDEQKVMKVVEEARPDVIINTAAITNVDGCEAGEELAFKVNAAGAGIVASAAEKFGAVLVHVSTDYVFDGASRNPYSESDPTCPINVYGKSKLAGEIWVKEKCSRYFIVRTAWLYGPHGNNFVKTMLKIGQEKGEVSVVNDQFGNPTSTFELVRIIDQLIQTDQYGIYHATCEGVCSWNEFARAIFADANMDVKVNDVTSEQFVRPAKRPAYSNLSKEELFEKVRYRPAVWQTALQEYFDYTAGKIDFRP